METSDQVISPLNQWLVHYCSSTWHISSYSWPQKRYWVCVLLILFFRIFFFFSLWRYNVCVMKFIHLKYRVKSFLAHTVSSFSYFPWPLQRLMTSCLSHHWSAFCLQIGLCRAHLVNRFIDMWSFCLCFLSLNRHILVYVHSMYCVYVCVCIQYVSAICSSLLLDRVHCLIFHFLKFISCWWTLGLFLLHGYYELCYFCVLFDK